MITYDDLKNCAALAREARNLQEYVETLRSMAEFGGLKSEDVNGYGDPMSDGTGEGAARITDIIANAQKKAVGYIEHVGYIDAAIQELENPTHRDILRMRFSSGLTWEEIASRTYYSEKWCRTLCDRALEALRAQKILCGRKSS